MTKIEQNSINLTIEKKHQFPDSAFLDTPNGPKNFNELKTGDLIYSFDLKNKKVETDTVVNVEENENEQHIKLKLKDTRNGHSNCQKGNQNRNEKKI